LAAYDIALRQRGSLTVWFTEAVIVAWKAEPRCTTWRPTALLGVGDHHGLTLRAVFRLALRPDRRVDRIPSSAAWSG